MTPANYYADLKRSATLLFNVDAVHTEAHVRNYIEELRPICQRLIGSDTAKPRRVAVSTDKLWHFYRDIMRLRLIVESAATSCTPKKKETAVVK